MSEWHGVVGWEASGLMALVVTCSERLHSPFTAPFKSSAVGSRYTQRYTARPLPPQFIAP